jgi:ABC-type sugar transport system ATPase subunit
MRRLARERLAHLGIDVGRTTRLDSLSPDTSRWSRSPGSCTPVRRIVILDEPTVRSLAARDTAAARPHATDARRGTGLVFVSQLHRDVIAVCDRVTVLRNGRRIATLDTARSDGRTAPGTATIAASYKHDVIDLMLGRTSARSRAAT